MLIFSDYLMPYALFERAFYNPIHRNLYNRTIIIKNIFKHPDFNATSLEYDFAMVELYGKI